MNNNDVRQNSWDICRAAGMGLWVIEIDDGCEPRFYVDDTFLEIMGMSHGMTPEEQFHAWYDDSVFDEARMSVDRSIDEMVENGQSENTYPCHHPVKGKIYVRCGGTIDRSYKDGIRLRGYHQDVTLDMQKEMEVREKLENALKEAKNANMAKTTFLSQMSHDIRTPLNGIIGLMEISEAHKDNYELVQENRCKARVSAKHLLDLINDILELSKLGDNNTVLAHEAFDLIKLSEDVMTISGTRAKESGITMIHAPYCDEMTVRYIYGSKLHIRQIFLNILDNAIPLA